MFLFPDNELFIKKFKWGKKKIKNEMGYKKTHSENTLNAVMLFFGHILSANVTFSLQTTDVNCKHWLFFHLSKSFNL